MLIISLESTGDDPSGTTDPSGKYHSDVNGSGVKQVRAVSLPDPTAVIRTSELCRKSVSPTAIAVGSAGKLKCKRK